jgi:hypothetical protein
MPRPFLPDSPRRNMNIYVPQTVRRRLYYLARHHDPPLSVSQLVGSVLEKYCLEHEAIFPDGGEEAK